MVDLGKLDDENNTAIHPYRSAEIIVAPKETFGLIIAPKPHICKLPGFWKRLFYLLIGKKIRIESLFRCPSCKEVWMLKLRGWDSSYARNWTAMGGVVSDKDDD